MAVELLYVFLHMLSVTALKTVLMAKMRMLNYVVSVLKLKF